MPKNLQNKICQTALKHDSEFRGVRTEALKWVKITIYTGTKIKFKTTVKERDQQLLESITTDVLNI